MPAVLPLLAAGTVLLIVATRPKKMVETAPPAVAYVWNPVPATAAGGSAFDPMQLDKVLQGPEPRYAEFAAMSTPSQYTTDGHVILIRVRGEIIGSGIDAAGKRYLDIRAIDRFPVSSTLGTPTAANMPAVGSIARIGDDAVINAANGSPLGQAVILPCIVTYSGGTTGPCVDPLAIDKAIQSGNFGIDFMMRRQVQIPGSTGLTSESYLMQGEFVDAVVDDAGNRKTRFLITSSSAPTSNAFFPKVGQMVTLDDNQFQRIRPPAPVSGSAVAGAHVGGPGLLFAGLGALALVVLSRGQKPAANSPTRSAECQQMWNEAGGNVSITKMPPKIADGIRAALAFGGMGAAASAQSSSDATQVAFRNQVADKFAQCGLTVLAQEIRTGKDVNGNDILATPSGAGVGAGAHGGGGRGGFGSGGFHPGYGYFHAQPQGNVYPMVYPYALQNPAAIVDQGTLVDLCARRMTSAAGIYGDAAWLRAAVVCAFQQRGVTPPSSTVVDDLMIRLSQRILTIAGGTVPTPSVRGNAALFVVDAYLARHEVEVAA